MVERDDITVYITNVMYTVYLHSHFISHSLVIILIKIYCFKETNLHVVYGEYYAYSSFTHPFHHIIFFSDNLIYNLLI